MTTRRFEEVRFEWDPEKARANLGKHRVAFEEAASIFQDPLAQSIFDQSHSEDEDRWVTQGRSESGRLLVVCHTVDDLRPRAFRIRLISARRATRKEKGQYEESSR